MTETSMERHERHMAEAQKLAQQLITLFERKDTHIEVAIHAMSLVIARVIATLPAEDANDHIATLTRNVRVASSLYAVTEVRK